MVAIQPSSRKDRRRISPIAIIVFVLGLSIFYVVVLVLFAAKNSGLAEVDEPNIIPEQRRDAKEVNLLAVLAVPAPTNKPTDLPVSTNQASSTTLEAPPQSKDSALPSAEEIDNSILSSSSATTSRGRNNFRNVVLAKSSKRLTNRKKVLVAKPHGEGVKPQTLVPGVNNVEEKITPNSNSHPDPDHILKAYVEPIDFLEWETKPLPRRSTATADQLEVIAFPNLNSCSKVPEAIPADEYPDHDPFLPWIHDVFPTNDGRYIQFVAQNRRRCHTGTTPSEKEILHLTQPNIALFQHVPLKRIRSTPNETRYRLASHDEADPDGIATRFICRFKPSMTETLSVFNFDYDYAAHRKRTKRTFQYNDGGILSVHLSQLVFRCPVPEDLVDLVKSGESVKDDWATLFLDIVPIRTPPRYGLSNEFMQPKYADRLPENIEERFDPNIEWGDSHVIPRIEDAGRWENIPICKPTEKHFPDEGVSSRDHPVTSHVNSNVATTSITTPKKHRLAACIWASAGYATRGNRFAVNDGQRRLLEWITLNKLLGFEHFYIYDNSYAFSDETTLKPIADLFPGEVTYIKWPFQVCNNNPNNVDSPGERSSQYAAESSCRLRFGPQVEWIGQFDIDEYLVPMGNYNSILPLLDKLDKEGTKILSFGSWRAWPRRDLIQEPIPIEDRQLCGNQFACFDLQVPLNTTVLQTYNCDRQSGPKKDVMPAEKQLYRPDYVLQHFIHYSSVTVLAQMNRSEFEAAGYPWLRTRISPDPHSRFSDELNEATMLHTKAIARQDTAGWQNVCKIGNEDNRAKCRIGVPFPVDYNETKHGPGDAKGWAYNCYVNNRTEEYWVPLLENALSEHQKALPGS